jgi:chromosome segregation ATPase
MFYNKSNKILELEDLNEAYAETQNQLNDKIGELDSQVGLVQAALDTAEVARDEARSALEQSQSLLADLEEDNERTNKDYYVLIDEFNEVSEECADLERRNELLKLVLKQLHIPVTLSAKKK